MTSESMETLRMCDCYWNRSTDPVHSSMDMVLHWGEFESRMDCIARLVLRGKAKRR